MAGHPLPTNRRRKRTQGELAERMGELCKLRKLTALDVSRQLLDEFPECGVVPQDVHNQLHVMRMEAYGTRNGTQLIFQELQDTGAIVSCLGESACDDGRPYRIFWTFPWCLDIWAENWELLSFDVAYKTNQFNMPLAQVTGITGCITTFSIAWALLDNKHEESHNWYLDELRHTTIGRQVRMPAVVISDYGNAFRAAR